MTGLEGRGRVAVRTAERLATGALVLWVGHLTWWTLRVGHRRVVDDLDRSQLFDWLVTYHHGFVRRGLAGQVLTAAADGLGVGWPTAVLWAQSACYVVLGLAVVVLLLRVRPTPALAVLVTSPALFAFPVLAPAGGFRKEVLAFAVLAVVAAVVGVARSDRVRFGALLAGLLAFVPVVLSHEGLVLLLPAAAPLATRVRWTSPRVRLVAGAGVLVLAAFLTTLLARGTPALVTATCDELARRLPPAGSVRGCLDRGAVQWLGRDVGDGIARVREGLPVLGRTFPPALLLVLACTVPAVVETARGAGSRTRRWWWAGLALSAAGTAVLMVVAHDWGRFLQVQAVVALLVALALRAGGVEPTTRRTPDLVLVAALPVLALTWRLTFANDLVEPGWWARLLG